MFLNPQCDDSSDEEANDCEDVEMECSNYKCLMCDLEFNDVSVMFRHVTDQHNFNMKLVINSANIKDEYDWIKIINYMRKNKSSLNLESIKAEEWKSDIYYQPVLMNDNLLFIDFNTVFTATESNPEKDDIKEKMDELINLNETILVQQTTISLLRNKIAELLDNQFENIDKKLVASQEKTGILTSEDKEYFSGYSHYSIHDTMIKDKVRTDSYRRFIEENGAALFKGKIVLDVGCGTSILSIFAARAGASHVYGVDCADVIYDAMAIVEKNGLKNKITLIHGKLEEIGLPCDKVDIVISEWMGYFLVYESMLDSVLYACRKYLDPEIGLVFPRYFTLNVLGADMSSYRRDHIDCWDSVYGIDMSSMKSNVIKEIIVDVVPQDDVVTSTCLLRDYDIQKMAFDDGAVSPQVLDVEFQLEMKRDGVLGAIVTYFDTYFLMPGADVSQQVMFSTGPHATATHWQQVVLLLDESINLRMGEKIRGIMKIDRHHVGKRGLTISLTLEGRQMKKFEFS